MLSYLAGSLEKLRCAGARATILHVTKTLWVASAAWALALAAGCSSSSSSEPSTVDASAARPPPTSVIDGGSLGDDTDDDASAAPTFSTSLRFAHLAPGLGSVDFCWRASTTDPFHGPLLGGGATTSFDAGLPDGDSGASDASATLDSGEPADAAAGPGDSGDGGSESADAGPGPLGYLSISPTLELVSSGTIDVIAVEPGTSCAAPLVLAHVALTTAARTTLLLAGGVQADASGGLGIVALGDEVTAADARQTSVRVVNAALVPSVGSFTAAFEQGGYDVVLADVVPPGNAASPSIKDAGTPAVDALGYTTVVPTASPPALRIVFDQGDSGVSPTWASHAAPQPLQAGEITTAFVGHDDYGYLVLWCSDASEASSATWYVTR